MKIDLKKSGIIFCWSTPSCQKAKTTFLVHQSYLWWHWSIPKTHLYFWLTVINLWFVICDSQDMGTHLKHMKRRSTQILGAPKKSQVLVHRCFCCHCRCHNCFHHRCHFFRCHISYCWLLFVPPPLLPTLSLLLLKLPLSPSLARHQSLLSLLPLPSLLHATLVAAAIVLAALALFVACHPHHHHHCPCFPCLLCCCPHHPPHVVVCCHPPL